MQGIAFFDLEVKTQPKTQIDLIGAYYEGKPLRTRSLAAFEQFVSGADYLCGHNIFRHDIPHLAKAGTSPALLDAAFIDTLYLSTLLFPSRPYHKLVKDYRLISGHLNNPVEDSRLAADLLADCLEGYHKLPEGMQAIFAALLHEQKEFAAFFSMMGYRADNKEPINGQIREVFQDRICAHADLDALLPEQSMMLAYALAVVGAMVALTALLIAGFQRFRHRMEHLAPHLPKLSAAILIAMGLGFLTGVL